MVRKTLATGAALSLCLMALTAQTAVAGPIGYSLGNGGSTLYRFDVTNPGAVTSVALGTSLDDIDFRPLDGQLYGYANATSQYFLVNPVTGSTTIFTTAPISGTTSSALGIDFNPTIDRLRTVTDTDENIVYNPNTGGTTRVTDLAYAAGDPNFGLNPRVVANGYTNSFNGAATTTQYVLDADLNILGILANNTGQITTVGGLTLGGSALNIDIDAGLDIFALMGGNTAYAMLNVGGVSGIYTIDLATAQASFLGALPVGAGVARGLAVEQVPEPGTVLLTLVGLGGLMGLRSRRRSAIQTR